MADILHRIGVDNGSPQRVYDALSTLDGLSGWWAERTTGDTDPGGVIEFRFGPGGIDMKVVELDPGRLVRWEVVGGPEEWIGTGVRFDIRQDGDWTTDAPGGFGARARVGSGGASTVRLAAGRTPGRGGRHPGRGAFDLLTAVEDDLLEGLHRGGDADGLGVFEGFAFARLVLFH